MNITKKHIVLFFFIFNSTVFFAQQTSIDSLLQVLKTDRTDSAKINTLLSICRQYSYQNPDSAVYYATKAKTLAEASNDKRQLVISLRELGWNKYQLSNYNEALSDFFESLELAQKKKYEDEISETLGDIGVVYETQGNYTEALGYYFKALKMTETLKDDYGISIQLCNLGVVYYELGDYGKSLEYYFKALKLERQLGYKRGIETLLGNIGIVYADQGDYETALKYDQEALQMSEELGNKTGMAQNYCSIANVYKVKEDYVRALDYYFKALRTDEELGKKNSIAADLCNIGTLYVSLNKYQEAEDYLLKALNLSREVGALDYTKDVEEALSDLYSRQKRFDKAFFFYKLSIAARDSISNEENTKKQTQVEMQFKFDKKEALRKADQDKRDAVLTEEKQKQNVILFSVSGFLLIVIVFALFIYRGYRQKQKINIEISRQKQVIEEKQKSILDSINYAKRIQESLLPREAYIEKTLKRLNKKQEP